MTENEAIKELETSIDIAKMCTQNYERKNEIQGYEMAIQALEEVMGDNCSVEAVKNIHYELTEVVQEHKEDPEPVVLDKNKVKTIFAKSGLDDGSMDAFDQCYDDTVGPDTELMLDNIYSSRSFEVKTPDVTVKVNPNRTDLVETKLIDGRRCLVIDLQGSAEVNGVTVKHM